MSLPTDFTFSQGNLQDFADCQRRFQLRSVMQLAWPAIEAEPALETERDLQLGQRFHLMVQQYLLGVSADRLSAMVAHDQDLTRWWRNFLNLQLAHGDGDLFPELSLTAPMPGTVDQRLVATYDLVVVSSTGRVLIYDWKTSRRRPTRQNLAQRLQTLVYPYVLVQAGAELMGGNPPRPDQVEMIYWFAEFPGQPEYFVYGEKQHIENQRFLASLAEQILRLEESGQSFPLTPVESRCRFCVYRSLCDRGEAAGNLMEAPFEAAEPEFDQNLDLDFEQIGEIVY
jgi:hypothetical protein